jgi:aspartate aminotransferase
MSSITANRLNCIQPSATLAISAKASELRAKGVDVISLASGEPDFSPPAYVIQAAIDAIKQGFHYYTPVDGLPSLKKAIQAQFKRDHGLSYEASQIIVSCGAKHSLYNLCQALLNPGDEVIIPAPYWVSYPDMVKLAEATPVIIDTSIAQDYKITAEQLESTITSKTKLLILNSPSNPTGMVYSQQELRELGAVLKKYPQVFIVSDDIYEYIYWGNEPYNNLLMQCPELYDRTILVNGISKAYAMTGWRIGYAAGHPDIIKAMKKVQSQSTSNPTAISQKAAEAALNGPQDCIAEMVAAYQARQQFMLEGLNAIAGMECSPTQGAFYLFVKVEALIKRLGLNDDIAFADYLLDKAQIAVVPGTAFGGPGHMRLSYATSDELLKEALRRLRELFA